MPMESKITLLNQFKKKLDSKFCAMDVDSILESLSECLNSFEVNISQDVENKTDDLLDTFINALRIQGRSEKTIKRYNYILGKTLFALGTATSDITVYHLRNYLAREKARGIDDSTIEGYRQIYSSYFNWLQRENLISKNPTVNLGKIKCRKKIKYAYSDVDIERLKQHCKNKRDRAIIVFLLSTGCRISEMTQLNRSDVDILHLECTVLGKGNKERTVYLDPVAGMILNDYLRSRQDDSDALFVQMKGKHERLNPDGIRKMLRELGKSSGVEHVHPHKFRRTRATNLIKHGMPIQEVAAILGHEHIDTTMGYVVMDQSSIKASYQKYG